MKFLGIIPSRYASTRFPGKPLVEIAGKTMIQRVYEQACKSKNLHEVVVATDDSRILQHVKEFGGKAVMTSPDHLNGTERCAEATHALHEFDYILNIQGDEPFVHEDQIDALCELMPQAEIGTLVRLVSQPEELTNSSVVKVVFSKEMDALYFSRSPIPFLRDTKPDVWLENQPFYRHIGMYGFRSDILTEVSQLDPTPLELAESLEQLRWLEHGYQIKVGVTPYGSIGIDTPEDLEKALQWI